MTNTGGRPGGGAVRRDYNCQAYTWVVLLTRIVYNRRTPPGGGYGGHVLLIMAFQPYC
jgi:hypothetical protein